MSRDEPTYVGEVQSVNGGLLSAVLHEHLPSTLLVRGQSYRLGQIGSFMRLPLGYADLYGIVTQSGAAAVPQQVAINNVMGARWLTIALFGESLGGVFARGVSQYPTVGDEVHLVTNDDLSVIYKTGTEIAPIILGDIAGSSGITARLDLSRMVSRHTAVVGSTGSGKSNLVSILLDAIAQQGYPNARVLLFDPHGEYAAPVGDLGYVFRTTPAAPRDRRLRIPYWALPFDELEALALGEMQQSTEAQVRDQVAAMKLTAAQAIDLRLDASIVTADSPVPFDIRQLWFDLDDYERRTYSDSAKTQPATLIEQGDAQELLPNMYPPPSAGMAAPYRGNPRNIGRQLDLLRSRIQDPRYSFLFNPGDDVMPNEAGAVETDLDTLVAEWVGHDRPITVIDVSGMPSEALTAVIGTMLRIIYDTLFWAGDLAISGRSQPILVVLEEAHLLLAEGQETAAHRTIRKIAKEGRKYGVGLMIVTQRPKEIDSTVLSQCGTFISLRLSNSDDRSRVAAALPDDLGGLVNLLPSLRTGEGLVIGEAMPIPSRILFRKAAKKPVGDDPDLAAAWRQETRPDPAEYALAVSRWRLQRVDARERGEAPDA